MLYNRKLKADLSITGLLLAIVPLVMSISTGLFLGVEIALRVLVCIIIIYTIFQYVAFARVKSLTYFLSTNHIALPFFEEDRIVMVPVIMGKEFKLSFDQLCESMGELFMEFIELFLKNEDPRIINRLNSLSVSVYS